jgi:drug/metabolite transporter (DMT)-like permease
MKLKSKGYILIVLAVIELSLLTVLSGLGIRSVGIVQFLFFIFLTSTAVSFAAVVAAKRLKHLILIILNPRTVAILSIAGILNYAVAQLFLTMAVKGTNPVVVSLVLKLWPIFLALMLPFTLNIKIARGQIIALFMGFIGIYLLATHGSIAMKLFGAGYIGIAILSTLATASSNIIIRSQNQDVFSQVFIFNASSLIFIAMIAWLMNIQFVPMDQYTIISFLFLGSISYALGALMFFYTFKLFDPLLMANATYATPLLTIFFSYLIMGTKFYAYYLLSFAFILVALIIQQHYAKRAPGYAPKHSSEKKRTNLYMFDISGAFVNTKNSQIINMINKSGRAIGAKISKDMQHLDLVDPSKYGCIMFTTKEHKGYASPEELEFIRDIVGAKEDEDVLVCIGKPEEAEKAINEYFDWADKIGKPAIEPFNKGSSFS